MNNQYSHIYAYVGSSQTVGNMVLIYSAVPNHRSRWTLLNLNHQVQGSRVADVAKDIFLTIAHLYTSISDRNHCCLNIFCNKPSLRKIFKGIQSRNRAMLLNIPNYIKQCHTCLYYIKRAYKGMQYFYTYTWNSYKFKDFRNLLKNIMPKAYDDNYQKNTIESKRYMHGKSYGSNSYHGQTPLRIQNINGSSLANIKSAFQYICDKRGFDSRIVSKQIFLLFIRMFE